MVRYIVKRLVLLVPTFFIILTVVFCLMRMVPGSPAYAIIAEMDVDVTPELVKEVETEMGFHDPIIEQWWRYMKGIFTGDWGSSYFNHKPVFENMIEVWEPTLLIAAYATVITIFIAIPVGIYSATHRNSLLDYAISSLSTATLVVPSFCLGLLFCYVFAFKLGLFPAVSYTSIARGGIWKALWSITLPSFALGLNHVASLARYTRSTMLDVLGQDYIRTARAKGLSRRKIYYKHALKNTLSVVGTMIAGSVAGMIGGAAVIEKVFNIRGMGTLTVDSLSRRDYSQEQAIIIFIAMMFLILDLLLDIMYKALDPRIEYE